MKRFRPVSRLRTAALFVLPLLAAACEHAPAALEVDGVRYSDEELGALTAGQRERLALLTAFGLVIAENRVDEFIRPYLERERADQLLQRLTLEEAARASGLDEAGFRAAYLAEPEYELTVRHLVILAERWRDDEVRADARDRARDALERVNAGEEFAAVAADVSEEPGADRDGGLLPPGRRGTWVPEFWSAAAALEEGAVSEVVETQFGFHVVELIERDTIPFDSIRYEALSRILDVVAAVPQARQRLAQEDERMSIERAVAMGIPLDSAALERVESEWRSRAAHLAEVFGFVAGGDENGVKLAAMQALADPRQSVRIALADLEGLRPALEGMYDLRSAAGGVG
ncbi:MAG TPA: peptidylprolyl isomerase [Longimicrobiales bacterium]|nr:peptidylprolyl isomerase [Longimicrobiales bacterium]